MNVTVLYTLHRKYENFTVLIFCSCKNYYFIAKSNISFQKLNLSSPQEHILKYVLLRCLRWFIFIFFCYETKNFFACFSRSRRKLGCRSKIVTPLSQHTFILFFGPKMQKAETFCRQHTNQMWKKLSFFRSRWKLFSKE